MALAALERQCMQWALLAHQRKLVHRRCQGSYGHIASVDCAPVTHCGGLQPCDAY